MKKQVIEILKEQTEKDAKIEKDETPVFSIQENMLMQRTTRNWNKCFAY